ncbi:MAG: uracil-xanthine permease family protein [Limnochordia bacterium]
MQLKRFALAFQHLVAMFGATVLVPLLTGLNVSVALFTSGLGTLIFHKCTQGKVPVYLGSSFAFIAPIIVVRNQWGLAYATGGIVVAGLVYVLMALVVRFFGVEKVTDLFPPVVAGPVIMVIGLTLAPTAQDMASGNWFVAAFTILVAILAMTKAKGYFNLLPVLVGVGAGYLLSVVLGIVDFSAVVAAPWIQVPQFIAPRFSLPALAVIAPLAFVTVIEHIGDIKANSTVVDKDFIADPGLHRTLIGDGIATSVAGLLGGPANTTYSENTGVLAMTKVYDPAILRITAVMAMALSFIGKFGAIISSIPTPVMGGISILLFGMIAAVGLRTLIENKVDLTKSSNLLIVSLILVFGISGAVVTIGQLQLVGMSLAAVIGVIANLFLNREKA